MITNRRKKNAISIHVGGLIITLESVIRYLKVVIDAKINFKYLDYACEIPANTSVRVLRIFRTISIKAACAISGLVSMGVVVSEARCLDEKRRVNLLE